MEPKPGGQRFCLYAPEQLDSVMEAMARQTIALLSPQRQTVLIGILRRGEPLARMLQQRLVHHFGLPELPLYPLKLKRYADDLTLLHAKTALTENPLLATLDLPRTCLLLVDDVLYEGHSLLRASSYLAQLGANEIRTAVLVDRCVCKQPIQADITGVRLQVAPSDIIECNVPPYEAEFRIDVLRLPPHSA